MVSPRKRSTDMCRMPARPASNNSSPDDWVSGSNFQFVNSPVITRRRVSTARLEKPKASTQAKSRRHSVLLKRLDLPLNSFGSSPGSNMRKTRRQSIAVSSSSLPLRMAVVPEVDKPASPKLKKNTRSMIAKLPPKTAAPLKTEIPKASPPKGESSTENKKESKIHLSPLKFYRSPTKLKYSQQSTLSLSATKRKALSEAALNKVEPTSKKIKVDTSVVVKVESKVSPLKKIGKASNQSPSLGKRKLRSAIPLRSARTEVASSPPLKKKSADTPKKITNIETSETKSEAKESQEKEKKETTKKNETSKSPKKEMKAVDSPRKDSKTPIKQVGTPKSMDSLRKVKTPSVKIVTTPKSQKKLVVTPKSQKKIVTTPKSQNKIVVTPKSQKKEKKSLDSPREKITTELLQKEENISQIILTSPKKISVSQTSLKLENLTDVAPIKKDSPAQSKITSGPQTVGLTRSSKLVSPSTKQKPASTKSPGKKSPNESKKTPAKIKNSARKVVKIKTPVSIKSLESQLINTGNMSTRSSARSRRKVTLIGESPKGFSFRKTPKKKSPQQTVDVDDVGASPILSARSQLEVIRARSPLNFRRARLASNVKPYTPKPDSPPSHVLRKTMKKKVAQKLHATTKVEVHQLMNGEISQPVRLISGISTTTSSITITPSKMSNGHKFITSVTPRKALSNKVFNGVQDISVTATTPASASNLPPTPTSSRKRAINSSRIHTSRTTNIVSKRALSTATPRSSTPIGEDVDEDEDILKSLKIDRESNFTDDSINTDQSEDESSDSEEKDGSINSDQSEDEEIEQPSPEKPKRSYCALM